MKEECDQPPTPPTCYEQAEIDQEERLEICENLTDSEKDQCIREAQVTHDGELEKCEVQECYEDVGEEIMPELVRCS